MGFPIWFVVHDWRGLSFVIEVIFVLHPSFATHFLPLERLCPEEHLGLYILPMISGRGERRKALQVPDIN